MIPDHLEINERIAGMDPCTHFDAGTYFTGDLFNHFCAHGDLVWVAVRGFYADKYGWSEDQCRQMHSKCPAGWVDGLGVWRAYDWGKGLNKVIQGNDERDWHEPQLDHVVPRSRGGADTPENMQVVPRLVNRLLSNITQEHAPSVMPVLLEHLYRKV